MPSIRCGWKHKLTLATVVAIATLFVDIFGVLVNLHQGAPSRLVSREVHTSVQATGAWSKVEIERYQP